MSHAPACARPAVFRAVAAIAAPGSRTHITTTYAGCRAGSPMILWDCHTAANQRWSRA